LNRRPLRPELEALLGVCPLSQLTQGVGGSSCSLLSGGVAVLCCCIGPPPARCSTRRGAWYGLADLPLMRRSGLPVRVIRSKRGWMLSCVSDRGCLPTLLSPLLSVSRNPVASRRLLQTCASPVRVRRLAPLDVVIVIAVLDHPRVCPMEVGSLACRDG
jgi:hypothetical protein